MAKKKKQEPQIKKDSPKNKESQKVGKQPKR
jgi:hypothetical protein